LYFNTGGDNGGDGGVLGASAKHGSGRTISLKED